MLECQLPEPAAAGRETAVLSYVLRNLKQCSLPQDGSQPDGVNQQGIGVRRERIWLLG